MMRKLGGWHRLWIFLSVIYLFIVVGFAVIFYNTEKNKIRGEYAQETISLALPQYREKYIQNVMTDLKQFLSNYDSESKLYYELKNSNIEVKLINGQYTIKLIEKTDFKLRKKPIKNFTGKSNFSDYWETEDKGKTLEFPDSTKIIEIIDKVEKRYREILNRNWNINDAKNHFFKEKNDLEIIEAVQRNSQKSLDFQSIDKKYKNKFYRTTLFAILFAFAFWIIPVITVYAIVYILNFSVRWIIRGFRKNV